jgi:hypothetical protein
MKRAQIDVVIEHQMTHDEFKRLNTPEFWKEILGGLRAQADAVAASVGGHVDSTVLPDLLEPQVKKHVLVGGDFLLFASRWTVLVPESFDVVEEARRDARRR